MDRWMNSTTAQEMGGRKDGQKEGKMDSMTAQEMEKRWMEGWADKQTSSGDASPHTTVPSPGFQQPWRGKVALLPLAGFGGAEA